jgi:hypothetical protein
VSSKQSLQRMIDLIEQAEQQLAGFLSQAERQRTGEKDHWAPKEVLAHNAGWIERQIENIRSCKAGGEPKLYDNYLELNDRDFEEYRTLSWQQAYDRSVSSRESMRRLLDELSEEELQSSEVIPSDPVRPTWQRIVGTAIEHPIIHLGGVYNEIGRADEMNRFQEVLTRELIHLAPEDNNWQGIVIYNLACQHALSGQKARAIEELRKGLRLNPGLTEWSKEDSDLDSLRDEPDYLATYSAGGAPGQN